MSQRFIATADLEKLAVELFNGGMAPLPRDPAKRRAAIAAEFARAHVEIAGVSRRDPAKFNALGGPFRAIAASRQRRVDDFLAALAPKPTIASVRESVVKVLGERALAYNMAHSRHQIAAALLLIHELETGRASGAQVPDDFMQAAKALGVKLDAFGPGARATFFPINTSLPTITSGLRLLTELAAAVISERETPAATSKPSAPSRAAAPSARAPAPAKTARMTRDAFNSLSAREKMAHCMAGGTIEN